MSEATPPRVAAHPPVRRTPRRVREEVRDSLAVAAFSVAASVVITGLLVLLWHLGGR